MFGPAILLAMGASDFTITQDNPATYSRDDLAPTLELGNEVAQELLPGYPPTPLDTAWAAHQTTPARIRRYTFRGWAADGSLAGFAGTRIDPEDNDNPDVLGTQVVVSRAHRRRGLGLALLAHVVALAREEGRTRVLGDSFESLPAAAAFAEAVGAEAKTATHMNHLPTAEVDRALMEKWVAEGPGRAPDYELLAWDGPIPDEHLEAFVDLVLVMNDAPRDDLELNDFTLTAEEWREGEQQFEAIGGERWTLVARRTTDGAFAGFHDVFWMPHEPLYVQVGATGVRPEHRGHALGKWLKATMTLRVLDERPDAEDIRTGNADSNDAMLGINREMGYRPLLGATGWELQVDVAAKHLADRGIELPAITPR
jgi:GNAT superfamily N-acetyltransferase